MVSSWTSGSLGGGGGAGAGSTLGVFGSGFGSTFGALDLGGVARGAAGALAAATGGVDDGGVATTGAADGGGGAAAVTTEIGEASAAGGALAKRVCVGRDAVVGDASPDDIARKSWGRVTPRTTRPAKIPIAAIPPRERRGRGIVGSTSSRSPLGIDQGWGVWVATSVTCGTIEALEMRAPGAGPHAACHARTSSRIAAAVW